MRAPSSRIAAAELGSARVSRVGFGVSSETVFSDDQDRRAMKVQREARDDETPSPARETGALPGILRVIRRPGWPTAKAEHQRAVRPVELRPIARPFQHVLSTRPR